MEADRKNQAKKYQQERRKKGGRGAQVGGKGGPSPLNPPNGDAFGPPLAAGPFE